MCFLFALLFTLATGRAAWSANPVSYVGDFNGDGWPDALLQPADPTAQVQIILADGTGNLTIPGQSWSADYLGLHWSSDTSQLVIGDFAGNGRDDVLLQPLQPGGTGAVLLSDAKGQFHAVTQLIANPYLGLDWSAGSHTLVVGDFTGNGRQDVLLQTAAPGGMNLIVEPNAQGVFSTTGQSWPDGYLGLQWSAQQVTLYVGDFTGNGQSDLLVQVNDPVSDIQVPAYALLLADGNGEFTQINQSWGVNAFGADWSPATHTLSIQDVSGNGMDDVVLMSKDPNGTNYLFLGNQTGSFSKPDLMWTGTQSAKAAWAANMASQASITATATTSSSSAQTQSASIPQPHVAAAPLNPVNAVGDMGGQSGVNGGAATYTIPIAVPPGRAGMQPTLSLSYSSRGGNSDLGMGWSLNGLSAITRCPATYAQDGYTQGVTYSATYDRLCLDGQHLIAVTGTYGSNGSVYRTELDSLVRVTLTGGSINSSAASFEVDYEDGRKAYYGTSTGTNTQFIASGASYPLVWAIAEEVDASGNNSIVYNYSAYGNGEYHIASIVYSGSANREADFTYTARSDPSSVWLAGGLTQQTQLLSQITTKVAGSEVQQWAFNYSTSAATVRSLLQSVQECGYAPGSGSLSCLPPDTFTWQASAPQFSVSSLTLPSNVPAPSSVNPKGLVIARDYLGTGVRQLLYFVQGTVPDVYILQVNTQLTTLAAYDESQIFSSPAYYGGASPIGPFTLDDDFNNDGAADLFGVKNGTIQLADSNHQSSLGFQTPVDTGIAFPLGGSGAATGDFTGHGLNDIVVSNVSPTNADNTDLHLWINPGPGGSGVFTAASPNPLITLAGCTDGYGNHLAPAFSSAGDLDGNGVPDFFVLSPCYPAGAGDIQGVVFLSQPVPGTVVATYKTFSQMNLTPVNGAGGTTYKFIDINGDGLQDYVYLAQTSAGSPMTWHYQLNQGNGTFGPSVDTQSTVATAGYQVNGLLQGDFRNDGNDVLLYPDVVAHSWCVDKKAIYHGTDTTQICDIGILSSPQPQFDNSVYHYSVLSFEENSAGIYMPTTHDYGIYAEPNSQTGDVNGDGLTDVFYYKVIFDGGDGGNYQSPCTPANVCGGAVGPQIEQNVSTAPDLLIGATTGFGVQSDWQYQPLAALLGNSTSGPYYSVSYPCTTAPNTTDYYCFSSSMYVVTDYQTSNDLGGLNEYTYGYQDAIYNNKGRGFQGFNKIIINDLAAGTQTINTYRQDFPLSGALLDEKVTATATGTLLSETANTWQSANPTGCLASTKVYWPQLTQSIVTKNGTSGENISTTTTSYSYDGNDNLHIENTTVSDASGTYSSDTTNTYASPDCTDWWTDELQQKQVVLTANYQNPIISNPGSMTRTASYTYTSLRKILTEKDDTADTPSTTLEKDTAYTYDSFGNATSVTLSSPSTVPAISQIVTRTTSSDYSGTGGYFADSVTNAAGQTTTITTDANTGQPLTVTDPNLVVTTYNYDAFGRKTSEQVMAPISLPATTISYQAPAAVCPSGTVYSVITAKSGFPGSTACYDLLNHVLRTATDGFASGDPSVVDTQYNSLGRVTQTSEPHNNEHTTVYWNKVNQYDVLNRVLSKTDAEGVLTTYSYTGLTATATTTPPDSPAFTTVTTTNSLGKLLSTVDANGSDTEFRYDVQGNPILIQDTAVHQTLATYNTLGQKTAVTDPDMGNWSYVYDVLGNLKQQTDAKNQVITQSFDVLNRMTARVQPEGTTNWCYDGRTVSSTGACTGSSAAPSIGKLTAVAQYSGYQQTYSYDGDGRVSNVHEVINGNPYDTSTTYDSDGHVSSVAYPAGVTDTPPVANAGANQTVPLGSTVTLDGSGSSVTNTTFAALYTWSELSGPVVSLSSPHAVKPTFTASTAGVYVFQLTVSDGFIASSATVTVTVPSPPAAPSGVATDGDPDHNGIYLVSWNTVTVSGQTITYHLEQATGNSSGPTSAFTEMWSGTAASDSLNNSSNSSYYYYYRVRAQDISGYSGYSATAGIHVVVMPSPTPSLSPGGLHVAQVNVPYTESWTTAGPKVTAYQLFEAKNDPSFGDQVMAYTGTGTSKSFTKTVADTDYYYRVQACNSSDGLTVCGAYSNTSHITINGTGGGGNSLTLPPANGTGTAAPAAQSMAAAAEVPSALLTNTSGTSPLALSPPSLPVGATVPVAMAASRLTPHSSPSSTWHYGPTVSEYYADAHFEPAASITTQVGLTVLYTYTGTGYLQQLSNAVYPSQVFWTANSEDAFGQVSSETYGAGVISTTIAHADPLGRITGITSGSLQNLSYGWDALGNLTSRSDTVHGTSEAFQYDLLNRLTSAQVTNSSGVQPALSYAYDALGDITYKSDTGTYSYGGGAGPHAVTSISGPAGGSYSYDANGNMVSRNGTVITWNSDNLPVSITQNSSNSSTFNYAPDKHRYYQSAMIASVSETTVYVGAFEAVTSGGVTKYRYHLLADSREVAEVDLSNSGSTVNETISYILSDHLGSVDVVRTYNAATGALISATGMSFGAFGNRREPSSWLPPVTQAEAQADHNADRYGFTHQEMLDNVGIVHMNGRIYDPNLGRFLSVDPVFEFPTNTQSLNPYSYVLNNPLSMTDPTGYNTVCITDMGCIGSEDDRDAKGNLIKNDSNVKIDDMKAGKDYHVGDVTVSKDAAGNVDVSGGSNGAQTSQTVTGAQTKPGQHTDIGSPAQTQANAAAQVNSTIDPLANTNFAGGAIALRNEQSSESSVEQELTYSTVGRGTMKQGTNYWTIDWKLAHPSKKGGYIVQFIRDNFEKSAGYKGFWEAWKVLPNSDIPVREPGQLYDDAFAGPKGIEILGQARFYEGMQLSKMWGHVDQAGLLPATQLNPNLPTTNATAPVTRWWDTNN